MNIDMVLYIISFILLLLAAFGVNVERVSLGWLGLAAFVLTFII